MKSREGRTADEEGRGTGDSRTTRGLPSFVAMTGHVAIDQFQPLYFCIALVCAYKLCAAMPDMPAFAERARFRRTD